MADLTLDWRIARISAWNEGLWAMARMMLTVPCPPLPRSFVPMMSRFLRVPVFAAAAMLLLTAGCHEEGSSAQSESAAQRAGRSG